MTRSCIGVALLAMFAVQLSDRVDAGAIRLTNNPNQDTAPAWDPASDRIIYMRSAASGGAGVPFNLYQVTPGGSGESVFATGPGNPWGIGNNPAWVGSTGLALTEERNVFHEYLSINSASAPYNRTANDGSQGPVTLELRVQGGGGGGWITVSRDGSTALWRTSSSGGGGTQQVRTAPFSSLTGQSTNAVGGVRISTSSNNQRLIDVPSLTPDGSQFVIGLPAVGPNADSSLPYDLWLYNTDGSGTPTNLTNLASGGISSRAPDISPDGTKILFSRWSGVLGETWDMYVMNLDGSDVQQVTDTPYFSEYGPSWANDGLRAAFVGSHIAGFEHTEPALPAGVAANSDIYVIDIIPEPSTYVMAILGATGLWFWRRRRS